jgi:hypothetical protein
LIRTRTAGADGPRTLFGGVRMKSALSLASAILLILFAAAGCRNTRTTGQGETPGEHASGRLTLAGYEPPLTVDRVIKKLGKPSGTYVDRTKPCPIGQLHTWDFRDGNYSFLVLGDDYEKEIDYSAGSRLIAIKKLDPDKPSRADGPLGLRLDDTAGSVQEKLEFFAVKNPAFHLSRNTGSSPFHRFFCAPDRFGSNYVLDNGSLYFFFLMDKKNRLEAVVEARFDIATICSS